MFYLYYPPLVKNAKPILPEEIPESVPNMTHTGQAACNMSGEGVMSHYPFILIILLPFIIITLNFIAIILWNTILKNCLEALA